MTPDEIAEGRRLLELAVGPPDSAALSALLDAAEALLDATDKRTRCAVDGCVSSAVFCATHADYDLSGTEERDALRAEVERLRAMLRACPACGAVVQCCAVSCDCGEVFRDS